MTNLFQSKKVNPQTAEKQLAETKKKAIDQAKSEMTGPVFRGQVRLPPMMGFGPPLGFPPQL